MLEYLAALYLLQAGSHQRGRPATVCYVAGAVILVIAAVSGRPLGGGPLPRPAHRVLDLGIVFGLVLAPFAAGIAGAVSAVLRLEALAVAWAAVVWLTNYAPRRARARPAVGTARVLRERGPRLAGQLIGRQLSGKRRPPGPSEPRGPGGGP